MRDDPAESGDRLTRGSGVLNSWPVNVSARAMLETEGEAADPEIPYILQLVLWAVREGKAEVEENVRETLNAMPEWREERLMNFLMLAHDSEYSPAGWEEAADATALALVVIEDFERKMAVHFPWYRSFDC